MAFLLPLALLGTGCSTWDYSVRTRPADGRVEPGIQIRAEQLGVGHLRITNGGPKRAYLVWDQLSAILPDGVQRRAIKGSQTRINAEASVPPQPIEPGATLSEAYVISDFPSTVASLPRPVGALDFLLGWAWGLGIFIADVSWTPDATYKAHVFPTLNTASGAMLYELVVPINFDGEPTQAPRLPIVSEGVEAKKR